MKPIFRWTIGNTTKSGYDCLEVAIRHMLKLYKNDFEYYICYNNSNIQMLREIIGHKPIALIKQNWDDCPLPLDYEKNQACWGGSSLWKFCPPRLDINRHEIISDNDIVFVKKIEQINEFLSGNKPLLVEDPIKCQGKFNHFFNINERYNAGFVGLPPEYNFKEELMNIWIENGSPQFLTQADEQGLATAAIKNQDFIKISKTEMMLVHEKGGTLYIYYDEKACKNHFDFEPVDFYKNGSSAYHFVTINKIKKHTHWEKFLKTTKAGLLL